MALNQSFLENKDIQHTAYMDRSQSIPLSTEEIERRRIPLSTEEAEWEAEAEAEAEASTEEASAEDKENGNMIPSTIQNVVPPMDIEKYKKRKSIMKIALLALLLVLMIANLGTNVSVKPKILLPAKESIEPVETLALQKGPAKCFINNETRILTIVCKTKSTREYSLGWLDSDFNACL